MGFLVGGVMEIITNHHNRMFKYGYEVPKSVLEDYHYLDEGEKSDGWIHYRSIWYHISDFMTVSIYSKNWRGWDGYKFDTFFSGVLIRISDDNETYQIGTYLS